MNPNQIPSDELGQLRYHIRTALGDEYPNGAKLRDYELEAILELLSE